MSRRTVILALIWLAGISPLRRDLAHAEPGEHLFDGAAAQKADAAANATLTPAPTPPNSPCRLTEQLKLEAPTDLKEQEALEEALSLLLKSSTAATLFQRLRNGKAGIKITFEDISTIKVEQKNGKKSIIGIRGYSNPENGAMMTVLNRNLIGLPLEELASVLGHELLGHDLGHLEAAKLGIAGTYDDYYAGNETRARLLGWIVMLELGEAPSDFRFWEFLENPPQYDRSILQSPLYAQFLSSQELADPVTAYQKRLDLAQAESAAVSKTEQDDLRFLRIIDHFISFHRLDPEPFKELQERLQEDLNQSLPARRKSLQEAQQALKNQISDFSSPQGQARIGELARDSKDPYFAATEQDIQNYRQILISLAGKLALLPNSCSSQTPGSISLDALKQMWDQDRAHEKLIF